MATETVTQRIDQPPYREVMLDIESLSLRPDALVLSIGAQTFTCDHPSGPSIGETALLVPHLLEQVVAGRHIDQGTQKWWADQPAAARSHWETPLRECTIRSALVELADFCRGAERIWANGICFDITVLEDLYRSVGIKVPWKYNIVRDARTVYDVPPSTVPREYAGALLKDLVPHNPVSDCTRQIIRLWEAGYPR